jgi:DNA-binding transcriptional MerR regulator
MKCLTAVATPFSIRELERFSQIKAHTIRIWEQRYQLFQPTRTPGNSRVYDIDALQHLLYISVLSKKGLRISHLAAIPSSSLSRELAIMAAEQDFKSFIIAELIISMFSIDTENLENLLNNSVQSFGMDATIEEIILPFLERVDLTSYTGATSATHLTVTTIRRKLVSGIEMIKPQQELGQSALLFLQQGEHFDLLLLYMAYVLKRSGFNLYYMDGNISKEQLIHLAAIKQPDFLFVYTPYNKIKKLPDLYRSLQLQVPEAKLYIVSNTLATEKEEMAHLDRLYYRDFAMWQE